jgi:hypothetical protein
MRPRFKWVNGLVTSAGVPALLTRGRRRAEYRLFDFCSELFAKDPQSLGSDHNGSCAIHPLYPPVSKAVRAYGRSDGPRQVPSPFAPIEAWPTQDTPRFLNTGRQRSIEINSHPSKKIDPGSGDKTGFIGQLRVAGRYQSISQDNTKLAG